MATRKKPRPSDGGRPDNAGRTARAEPDPARATNPVSRPDGTSGSDTTGSFIVIFKAAAKDQPSAARSTLNNVAGLKQIVTSSDFEGGAMRGTELDSGTTVLFQELGIAVVSDVDAVSALAASTSDVESPILAIEPEYIGRLSAATTTEYLRGYRDAVNHLYIGLEGEPAVQDAALSVLFRDTAQFSWGLQATRVHTSSRTGQGIRVAVLDTGIDLNHPDFAGRAINARSFVPGVTVHDVNGHGTHCIGAACGPQAPATGVRRYGIAFAAQIFAGKVFDNAPRPGAQTRHVIAGIEWAMLNGCRVVSLSLGIPINQKVMQYEVPIRRALEASVLVVAAAGNNANRPFNLGFVEPPANADASVAVAAVDQQLRIASFSARSSQLTGTGGIVNIAGPGVSVFSTVPVNLGRHDFFDGTSMATPHIAGIAALWAQATGESGQALWNRLVQSVQPLTVPSIDVGSGLLQAPQ